MRILSSILATGTVALAPLGAGAATLEYDFPIPTVQGGTGVNEIRATFLEVLKPIELESLTAELALNRTVDITAAWTIYNSNANDDVLSTVVSVDASFSFAGARFERELFTTDIGVALEAGYYLFTLQTDAPLFYSNYREQLLPDDALPLVTDDGAFRVIDGGIINFAASDPSIISGNVTLPAISAEYAISVTPAPVPLPAGGLLLGSALGLGALVRARRRKRAA